MKISKPIRIIVIPNIILIFFITSCQYAIIPTPTVDPQPSMVLACAYKAMYDYDLAMERLGCPIGDIFETDAKYQLFERGQLLHNLEDNHVYVKEENGEWEIYSSELEEQKDSVQSDQPEDYIDLLWNQDITLQESLGAPLDTAETKSVEQQEYEKGTLFSFDKEIFMIEHELN